MEVISGGDSSCLTVTCPGPIWNSERKLWNKEAMRVSAEPWTHGTFSEVHCPLKKKRERGSYQCILLIPLADRAPAVVRKSLIIRFVQGFLSRLAEPCQKRKSANIHCFLFFSQFLWFYLISLFSNYRSNIFISREKKSVLTLVTHLFVFVCLFHNTSFPHKN